MKTPKTQVQRFCSCSCLKSEENILRNSRDILPRDRALSPPLALAHWLTRDIWQRGEVLKDSQQGTSLGSSPSRCHEQHPYNNTCSPGGALVFQVWAATAAHAARVTKTSCLNIAYHRSPWCLALCLGRPGNNLCAPRTAALSLTTG